MIKKIIKTWLIILSCFCFFSVSLTNNQKQNVIAKNLQGEIPEDFEADRNNTYYQNDLIIFHIKTKNILSFDYDIEKIKINYDFNDSGRFIPVTKDTHNNIELILKSKKENKIILKYKEYGNYKTQLVFEDEYTPIIKTFDFIIKKQHAEIKSIVLKHQWDFNEIAQAETHYIDTIFKWKNDIAGDINIIDFEFSNVNTDDVKVLGTIRTKNHNEEGIQKDVEFFRTTIQVLPNATGSVDFIAKYKDFVSEKLTLNIVNQESYNIECDLNRYYQKDEEIVIFINNKNTPITEDLEFYFLNPLTNSQQKIDLDFEYPWFVLKYNAENKKHILKINQEIDNLDLAIRYLKNTTFITINKKIQNSLISLMISLIVSGVLVSTISFYILIKILLERKKTLKNKTL